MLPPCRWPCWYLPMWQMSTASSPSCFSIMANDWILLCIVEPSRISYWGLLLQMHWAMLCFLFCLWWMLIDLFPWLSQNTTCPEMAPSTVNWALIHFSVEVPSFHTTLVSVKLTKKQYNWGEVGYQYIRRERWRKGQVILRMFEKVKVIHIFLKLHIIPLSIYYFIIS